MRGGVRRQHYPMTPELEWGDQATTAEAEVARELDGGGTGVLTNWPLLLRGSSGFFLDLLIQGGCLSKGDKVTARCLS
jgi:hypothetical protein